jgi:hypothetical protein
MELLYLYLYLIGLVGYLLKRRERNVRRERERERGVFI